MRCGQQQVVALLGGFFDEGKLGIFQVAQATMDHAGGCTARAAAHITFVNQQALYALQA